MKKGWLTMLLLFFMLVAADAHAWWNKNWEYRKKITLDTTSAGGDIAGTSGEIPVMVRLHTGNFLFTQARQDGADIRFVSGDDLTQLKHHFEWYDSVDEVAIVWVKVPKISGASKQDSVWMYYGNEDAIKGEDAAGTFDKNTVAAFHFTETEGQPKDATGYTNHAQSFAGGQGLPSIIGKGISLSGGKDHMVIQNTPSLDISGGFTFTAWVKMGAPQPDDSYLLSRTDEAGVITLGIDKTKLYCRVSSGKDETLMTGPNTEVAPGDWHHVAVTSEHKGVLAMYIDGKQVYKIDLSPTLPNLSSSIVIGSSAAGDHAFTGEMDEVTLSNTSRTEAWVKTAYAGQIPQSKLLAFADEENYEGGSSQALAYIAVIIRNVTPFGWFIIAITLVILAWCVVIYIDKVRTLHGMKKGNMAFEETTRGVVNLLDLKENAELELSPLYRVQRLGNDFLQERFRDQGQLTYLPPKAMSSFRFELERGAVRESQDINSKLVVMTIGIAGGPFLGLLGTVWGVMETFAAMAMVGEANIMAIAPGVASALACTVVGLILAIPALFGYNYITTQIKNVMADVFLFIDRFAANVEENYGEKPEVLEHLDDRRAVR